MHLVSRFIKYCYAQAVILLLNPLCAESLRTANKNYFDAIDWKQPEDIIISPIPEPYSIPSDNPIPYGDMALESGLYPSDSDLGILNYRNITEPLLILYDTIKKGFIAHKIDASLFSSKRAFLPYLTDFILKDFPAVESVLYARPSFKQNGTAYTDFKITFKTTESLHGSTEKKDIQSVHQEQKKSDNQAALLPSSDSRMTQLISLPAPISVIVEISCIQNDTAWLITSFDIKETVYADSFNTD